MSFGYRSSCGRFIFNRRNAKRELCSADLPSEMIPQAKGRRKRLKSVNACESIKMEMRFMNPVDGDA